MCGTTSSSPLRPVMWSLLRIATGALSHLILPLPG
jgi:hypothetical protein